MEWNHFDENGNAVMVDVSEKDVCDCQPHGKKR